MTVKRIIFLIISRYLAIYHYQQKILPTCIFAIYLFVISCCAVIEVSVMLNAPPSSVNLSTKKY